LTASMTFLEHSSLGKEGLKKYGGSRPRLTQGVLTLNGRHHPQQMEVVFQRFMGLFKQMPSQVIVVSADAVELTFFEEFFQKHFPQIMLQTIHFKGAEKAGQEVVSPGMFLEKIHEIQGYVQENEKIIERIQ
jgi:hypothetical protein